MNAYSVRGPDGAPANVGAALERELDLEALARTTTPNRQSSAVAPPGAVIVACASTVANPSGPRVRSSSGPGVERSVAGPRRSTRCLDPR